MMGSGDSFDLTTAPWLPVVREDGVLEVSLEDALVNAHRYGGLAPEVPTMIPALLRQVLLPVLIEATGVPRNEWEWGERWRQGCFDAVAVGAYLEMYRERFDLLHPAQPFAQVAGLATVKGDVKPSSLLIPAVATGNNVPLFTARTERDPVPLTLAEAARWLLHVHCWDTAAIKSGAAGDPLAKGGKTTGNPVGALGGLGVIVPLGRTLFETLMLNLRILPSGLRPDDTAQWRRPPASPTWETRPTEGLLELLTWQSRRVRLIPDEVFETISSVVLAAGDRLPAPVPDLEMHTAWTAVEKPKSGQPPWRPRRHVSGRAAWQGLESLLAVRGSEEGGGGKVATSHLLEQISSLEVTELADDFPLRVLTVGIEYGNQSAVVENLISDELPIPVAALRGDPELRQAIEGCAREADELARAVDFLSGDIRRAAGGEPTPWDRGERPGTQVIQRLDPVMRRLLAGLSAHPQRVHEARAAWLVVARRVVMEIADRVLSAAPPAAYTGRSDGRGHLQRVAIAELRFRKRINDLLGPVDRAEEPTKEAV